jgi:outer membrane protein assembly factor BamB
MRNRTHLVLVLSGALLTLTALAALAIPSGPGDWPQWRGPDRNGLSKETGLLKSWPQGGPRLLWKTSGLGGGYSTISVARGRLYTMAYQGEQEVVECRSAADGKPIWTSPVDPANHRFQYGEGSRCQPTVDGDRLYVEGTSGDVACLTAADGKLVWHKNLVTDFGGSIPNWGYAESPLVDGEKLIVTPGRRATIVALNKMTGEPIWSAQVTGGDPAAYSSAIRADVGGKPEYIQFTARGVVGVSATDGKFLWRWDSPASGINISTPLYSDGQVFAASGYGKGGGLLKLAGTPDGGVTPSEVYFSPQYENHHGGILLVDGYVYYSEGHRLPAYLVCREFATGKLIWRSPEKQKGSLTYADGHLYFRNERGPVSLVEATPKAYVETGRFDQPERSGAAAWSHPVVAGGRLYIRDQDNLFCYDIKG